ncbi:hypothetical protein BK789_19870, partial [Bacillus thuringiensis serovar darmstadiensis]
KNKIYIFLHFKKLSFIIIYDFNRVLSLQYNNIHIFVVMNMIKLKIKKNMIIYLYKSLNLHG